MLRAALCVSVLLATVAVAKEDPTSAHARAEVLAAEGLKEYLLGHHQDALKDYEEAFRTEANPSYLYNIGQCYRQLGDHKHAVYSYKGYLATKRDASNREEVEKLIQTEEAEIQRQQANAPPMAPLPADAKPTEGKPVEAKPADPKAIEASPAPAPVVAPPITPQPEPTPDTKAARPDIVAQPAAISESPPPKKSRTMLVVGIVGAVVLVGAAIAIGIAASGGDSPPNGLPTHQVNGL